MSCAVEHDAAARRVRAGPPAAPPVWSCPRRSGRSAHAPRRRAPAGRHRSLATTPPKRLLQPLHVEQRGGVHRAPWTCGPSPRAGANAFSRPPASRALQQAPQHAANPLRANSTTASSTQPVQNSQCSVYADSTSCSSSSAAAPASAAPQRGHAAEDHHHHQRARLRPVQHVRADVACWLTASAPAMPPSMPATTNTSSL